MEIRKCSGLLACAGLLALALLSGCGSSSSTSTTIPSTATVTYSHTLIFGNNSTPMTMGYNGFGQLGDGTLSTRASAAVVPGLGRMAGGATGAEHTLVFGNNSSVMAWGYNLYGQLGSSAVATIGTDAYSATPVKVPLHAVVSGVAAGAFHSLAVAGGTVFGWGYNVSGQVGDGTSTNSATPAQVKNGDGTVLGTSPQAPVTQVAAGGSHSLALTAGKQVYAWGSNASGQLGKSPTEIVASATTATSFSLTPVLVNDASGSPLSEVVQIAAAGSNSYARKSDGTVWAWGYNSMGQLGKSPKEIAATATTAAIAATPYSFIPVQVLRADGTPVIATRISAGLDHVLALLADGSVLAWGFNQYAQLGDNSIVNTYLPVQVLKDGTAATGPLAGVTDIIAFGHHSLAKVGEGWYGWGDNGFGQLGNPISTSSIGYLLVPQPVQWY